MINSKRLFELDDKIARIENQLIKIRRRLTFVEDESLKELLLMDKVNYENCLKYLKKLRDEVLKG